MALALIEPTVFAAAGVIALVAAVALALSRLRTGAPERARPGYLGPDAAEVEAALLSLLQGARREAGLEELRADVGLEELARHQAHWMSANERCEAVDDQGRDVEGRRQALYPILAGPVDEAIAAVDTPSADPERCAAALLTAVGRDIWLDREFTAGAAGVAVAAGVLYCAVVVARRLGVFEEEPSRETVSALPLAGILAEAAPRGAEFRAEGPGGESVAVDEERRGERFVLTCRPTIPGEHVVRLGEEVFFVFEFVDHRLP